MTDKDDDGFDIEPIAQVVIAEDYYAHVVFMEGVDTIALDQQWLYADYVDRRLWKFSPITGKPLRPDLAEVGEIGVWGEGKGAEMTDEQPEALRLADQLERMSLSTRWDKKAADELRRLHEEVQQWQDKCNTYIKLHDAVVKDNDRLYAKLKEKNT